ncbi:MAG TPA: hypothetical protein VFQ65_10445 [Kofleriaceae bacterium]|nr:hypothetical protein [Kofleriaceae bacterium]
MSEALYRESDFVERCFCDEPGPTPCACCHQPRCAAHLTGDLCTRCTQAVERQVRRRVGTAWLLGGAGGVLATLVLLPLVSSAAVFVGLGTALGAGLGTLRVTRARAIATLGRRIPLRGELPGEVREAAEPPSTSSGMPPGGYG